MAYISIKYIGIIYFVKGALNMYETDKKLLCLEIAAFVFTAVIGSMLHFTYEWSGQNSLVGLFSPINESIWEHLKLGFFSILFFSIIQNYSIKETARNFFIGKLTAAVVMNIIIVVVFYAYTYFTKHSILAVDISLYFVAALIGHILCYNILKCTKDMRILNLICFIAMFALALLFMCFTYYPPDFKIFQAPTKIK